MALNGAVMDGGKVTTLQALVDAAYRAASQGALAEFERDICLLMDALTPEQLHLRVPSSSAQPEGAAIRTQCVYEDSLLELVLFVFPAGASIPLHDHPHMSVFSKVLYGQLSMTSYDWLVPPTPDELHSTRPPLRPAAPPFRPVGRHLHAWIPIRPSPSALITLASGLSAELQRLERGPATPPSPPLASPRGAFRRAETILTPEVRWNLPVALTPNTQPRPHPDAHSHPGAHLLPTAALRQHPCLSCAEADGGARSPPAPVRRRPPPRLPLLCPLRRCQRAARAPPSEPTAAEPRHPTRRVCRTGRGALRHGDALRHRPLSPPSAALSTGSCTHGRAGRSSRHAWRPFAAHGWPRAGQVLTGEVRDTYRHASRARLGWQSHSRLAPSHERMDFLWHQLYVCSRTSTAWTLVVVVT